MDIALRRAQERILSIFSDKPKGFALSGGTALELYYLHHRFSADLDFFSPKYNLRQIDELVSRFAKCGAGKARLESEFFSAGKARVRFYTLRFKGSKRPLKLDFIEDVLFAKPLIKRFNRVPVYSAENIYLQKITAVAGMRLKKDEVGRETAGGRGQARDAFDIYILSKKIQPLHIFLQKIPRQMQRGMIQWYRSFSRQDLKLALLDLDIYDAKFNAKEMIVYLEDEIKNFMTKVLNEA